MINVNGNNHCFETMFFYVYFKQGLLEAFGLTRSPRKTQEEGKKDRERVELG
jgi:hypothetical protein